MVQPHFIDLANAPERSDENVYIEFVETKDRELMAHIFRKHMTLVFGVCMKYVGEKHGAQDASMEIFERLLMLEINTEIKNFKAFLYVMTRNYCSMKKRGEKVIHIEISDQDMAIATEVHPIDQAAKKEKALRKCLDQLKDMQKACVEKF